ncbi:competence protein ComE [Pontibacillus chungwhensis BH030062]|uniref:ComE operon protein 2 n=1 Tax=Pontibacillus chungwhensis BH030062 TaxID=1385513 RepID=A0A0A2URC4_9BACI|nr:ComE operon protein 2 [Pontibacillus chungwhensis]KGP90474.1 competence protein ComE [Pontibacillus chungwhensis BH030062]
MNRISWDQYFMAQSHLLALRSTCERLAVGATVVRDKRMIAGGYNGSVSGSVHCIDEGCYVIDGHCVRTIHAEMNALLQCAKFGVATEGAEIYVTHFPCLHCCKALIQAGIQTVYYAQDYKNHPYAIELFKEAGVQTVQVEVKETGVDPKALEKLEYINGLIERLSHAGAPKEEIESLKEEAMNLFSSHHITT